MNGLSWLLYLSETMGGLREALVGGGVVILAVGTIAGVMVATFPNDVYSSDSAATKAAKEARPGKAWKALKTLWVVAPIAVAIGLLLPSRNTVMLIAASEIGETVITSDAAQDIGGEAGELATDSLKLLRKYVTEQLGETETPSSP